ncbi:cytochrome P450 [Trametes meyenii]|nr:cytochrome P450 [Trametes meyenii]
MQLVQALILGFIGTIIVRWVARRVFFSPFRNIPGPPSASFLKGNYLQLTDRLGGENWTKNVAQTYGPAFKLSAPFGQTWLFVYDPKAMYSVAIKDQEAWEKNLTNFYNLLLGPGLLTTEGAQHRRQRKMLTPVFSAAHLRNVTPLFYETSYKLRDAIMAELRGAPKEVDVLNWMGRAALELIGQGALGYSFDPLVEDVPDSFADSVKSFFGTLNNLGVLRFIGEYASRIGPAWLRGKIVDWTPIDRVRKMRRVVDVMHTRSMEIMEEKRRAVLRGDDALMAQIGEGKDVMSILLKANMAADAKEKLTDDELIAQMSVFILAGMDTTSNAASRILHILSQRPEVQKKLRLELSEAHMSGDVDYEQLMELPYLDAVCRETLRLYSPVHVLSRRAVKDTVLPLSEPILSTGGSTISEVPVPKGSVVVLGLWASNTNSALWGEDAYEWKPERWLSPLPPEVEEARIPGVYSNLMSFFGGGRSCIGFKYAQLELKVVLSVLLRSFMFEPTGQPIYWNHAGVMYPTVGKTSLKPEMPLIVSKLY